MVTRSIVGRFLILTVLLVSLGVIAQAALIITRGPGKKVASLANAAPVAVEQASPKVAMNASTPPAASAPLAPTTAAPSPAADTGEAAPVRVVYPGPLGNAPVPLRKIPDPASVSPLVPPVSNPAPLVAAAAPSPAASAPPAPAVAAAPPAPAPAQTPVVSSVEVASADPSAAIPAPPPTSDATAAGKGSVDLNSASVEALNKIGGGHIGQSIVSHRPYHSVEDLVKKRVLRRAVYEQIKNQVAAQ